jgi:hypothetical protein
MTFTTAALMVAWVAIAVLALGFAGLMRQLSEVQRAVAGSTGRSGALAPVLTGLALPREGDLGALRPAAGGLVAFVSPGCPSCEVALGQAAALGVGPSLVIASTGPCPSGVLPGLEDARCVGDTTALMERLGVPGTPYLMEVDAAGVIGRTILPGDADQVRDFLAGQPAAGHGQGGR